MNSGWIYFSIEELRCKCGCGKWDMDDDFMDRLVALRTLIKQPLYLVSAFRCAEYDKIISNKSAAHVTGHAVDIKAYGYKFYEILSLALELGFTGIGVSQKGAHNKRFIHLDDLPESEARDRPWGWSY